MNVKANNGGGSVTLSKNLRQVALLAASGSVDTPGIVKSPKEDIVVSNIEIDRETARKPKFWTNDFCFRENSMKNEDSAVVSNVTSKCDEKWVNFSSKRTKYQHDGDEAQSRHSESKNIGDTGDCISELIGHIGLWQIVWIVFLIMFQVPSSFHILSFVF